MKFDCGLSWEDWSTRRKSWHRWFAWRPVRLASHDCRWLEYVLRKGTFCIGYGEAWWEWEYRRDDEQAP